MGGFLLRERKDKRKRCQFRFHPSMSYDYETVDVQSHMYMLMYSTNERHVRKAPHIIYARKIRDDWQVTSSHLLHDVSS